MTIKEIWWRARYFLRLIQRGGWRDVRMCHYLARVADWEGGFYSPIDAADEELSYMASDIG